MLLENGYNVNLMFISRAFKKWRWSFKRPSFEQLHKYTRDNVLYYAVYQQQVKAIPWRHLKFADESHFSSRGSLLESSHPRFETKQDIIADKIRSGFQMMHLSTKPTQWRFWLRRTQPTNCRFWVASQRLKPGDYFIVDNAQVHVAEEILEELVQELGSAGVQMKMLPTYSPELNPCEQVFARMKNHLRHWRGDQRFLYEIIKAGSLVTYSQVVGFYNHCLK